MHVLVHHSHKVHHNHSNECKHHHHTHEAKTTHNKPDYQGEVISNYEKTCPICDYQFPIKSFSKKASLSKNKAIVNEFICELEIKIPYKQVNSIKTPRAPPASIS